MGIKICIVIIAGTKVPDDGFVLICGNNMQSQKQLNSIKNDFLKIQTVINIQKNNNNTALIVAIIVATLIVFISAGDNV